MDIPLNEIVGIAGVSGSGKSSLALGVRTDVPFRDLTEKEKAIRIENDKPVWVKNKCQMCLQCLHRCPRFAIQYDGRTQKHGQYVHLLTREWHSGQEIRKV